MRQIKFRGKRLDNGKWATGDLIHSKNGKVLINAGTKMFTTYAVVNPDTVGQFTGLLDKNGKEIYEGDIVKNKEGTIDVITYDSLAFALCVAYATSPNGVCATFFGNNNPLKNLEVIGNIHDNPELLSANNHFKLD